MDLPTSNIHEHPELNILTGKGGLFDVGPNKLDEDIGCRVRFKDPGPTVEEYVHVIVCIQEDYKGDLCYRVQIAEDNEKMTASKDIGRVAHPSEVEFVGGKRTEGEKPK
jgi:hypothetical protein